jgi:hypothetical protein
MRHRTTPGPCRGMSCARGCRSRWRRRSGWRVRARARGEALVGWQRWRRPLLAQTGDQVIVCAHGDDGIFPLAAYSRRLGVQRHEVPPDLGSRPQVLAKYRLSARDEPFYWNFRTCVMYY